MTTSLQRVLSLTPEQVMVRSNHTTGVTRNSRARWYEIQTLQRLMWLYGLQGAQERLNRDA